MIPDEFYVMNYLLALASRREVIYHPVQSILGIPTRDAVVRLLQSGGLKFLASQFGCEKNWAFTELRRYLDRWDGAIEPEHVKTAELTEADADVLLFDTAAWVEASEYLDCNPNDVLGELFDARTIRRYCAGTMVPIPSEDDSYKLLRVFKAAPDKRQRLKRQWQIPDWWMLLEQCVKRKVRKKLSDGLDCDQTRVVRELFGRIKSRWMQEGEAERTWRKALRGISLGHMLTDETARFWETIEEFAADIFPETSLDDLKETDILTRDPAQNVMLALNIARSFARSSVQPLEAKLKRVDLLGMVALRHRFRGIVDGLLGAAVYYASLAKDAQFELGSLWQAIQFYGQGAYRKALEDLLSAERCPLMLFGLEYRISNPHLKADPGGLLIIESREDKAFAPVRGLISSLRQTLSRVDREVQEQLAEEGYVTVRYQSSASAAPMEVLRLNGLSDEEVNHLRTHLPQSVANLTEIGDSIGERILNTSLPILPKQETLRQAVKLLGDDLVRSFVLTGSHLPQKDLLPSVEDFGHIVPALPTDVTVEVSTDLQSIVQETITEYRARGRRLEVVSGI